MSIEVNIWNWTKDEKTLQLMSKSGLVLNWGNICNEELGKIVLSLFNVGLDVMVTHGKVEGKEATVVWVDTQKFHQR